MNGKKLDAKIKQAFSRATPDVLDTVLAQWERQETNVIPLPPVRKKRRWPSVVAAAAAILVLFLGLGLYQSGREVVSTVALDVNPGIEIEANRWGRVLTVRGCNAEGRSVIENKDFKGLSLEQTVNWLIDALVAQGYLGEGSGTVLISILDTNEVRGQSLESSLTQRVNSQLRTDNVEGTVLSQTVVKNDEVNRIADEYGVTKGKAFIMKLVTEMHAGHSYEELSTWSIQRLWNMYRDETAKDQPTTTYYVRPRISEEGAKALALDRADVSPEEARDWEYRLEYWLTNGKRYTLAPAYAEGLYQFSTTSSDHGSICHIVSFTAGGQRYEFILKDFTGEITENNRTEESE